MECLTFTFRGPFARCETTLQTFFHPFARAVRSEPVNTSLTIGQLPLVSAIKRLFLLRVDNTIVVRMSISFCDKTFPFDVVTEKDVEHCRITKDED